MTNLPAPGSHVVVGLSGGVDSAVSAYLLKQRGCRVSALFMVNWTEDEQGYCTAAQDFQDARSVCAELDIALHRVDFSAEYRQRVFEAFLADYRAGKTPNPDVLCNREVKFGPFADHARRLGADFIATGHYAQRADAPEGPVLLRATDENKDQTYFLALVERAALARVTFPVGHLPKAEVRRIALAAGLPNHDRRDSTGICFIGERPFRDFLARYLAPSPGPIVDDHGRPLGEHQGLMFYTLGQRRGLRIGGRSGAREAPWYVVGKDAGHNVLRVSQDADHPELWSDALVCTDFHWLAGPAAMPAQLHARIRHRQALQPCTVSADGTQGVRVSFDAPQRAVTTGQYCVLYAGRQCLGGGEISAAERGPAQPGPRRSGSG